MAAGKKDEKADSKDAAAGASDAKQKKKKMFMFIGLGLLLVLISVGATFFIVSKMLHKGNGGEKAAEEEQTEEKAPATPAIYLALTPNFTVNFDVNGRQRFLQTELTLMYRDATLEALLKDHMPAVRNGIVMLLSRQVFDELQTAEGKEKLRAEALKVVQEIIAKESEAASSKGEEDKEADEDDEKKVKGTVENVLFTQFVMQ